MQQYDIIRQARMFVADYINEKNADIHEIDPIRLGELSVVWYSKTINNWIAFISTNIPNGIYYEVGTISNANEIYLKEYHLTNNIIINNIESKNND